MGTEWTSEQRQRFREALRGWYERQRRQLPWRQTDDPYKIWVSEIMLQQTQVATAQPYYERFIAAYPTVHDLAAAPIDDVLKLWEGLGYYARARNLHRAAQTIVEAYDGQLPASRDELLQLPGIGPYTVGAILSIAFGQPEPALDGNVRRVMSRLLLIEEDPRRPAVERAILDELRELISTDAPADFNQALMELGATICVAKSPRCLICPVLEHCQAQAAGRQFDVPVTPKRSSRPHHHVAVGLIWHENRLLISRRPSEGLLGGLWELPGGKQETDESLEGGLRREIAEELGIDVAVDRHLVTVEHGYSHFSVTLHAFQCRWLSGEPTNLAVNDWAWVPFDRLRDYPLPRGTTKILDALASDQKREEEERQDHLQEEE